MMRGMIMGESKARLNEVLASNPLQDVDLKIAFRQIETSHESDQFLSMHVRVSSNALSVKISAKRSPPLL
jgi:hypothetical protein